MEIFSDIIHVGYGDKEALLEGKGLYSKYKDKFSKHSGWEKDNHSLTDPTFKSNILKEESCNTMLQMIQNELLTYLKLLGHSAESVEGFDLTESWLTHTINGESARQHNHGSIDIAGVYYIHSNYETDGGIYFLAPETVRYSHRLYRHLPNMCDIDPLEGTIILFPGWLNHGTRVHQGEDPRISLSFNINLAYK